MDPSEELAGRRSPGTWLARVDAHLEGQAASWAEKTPEIISILSDEGIENATISDKNTFVQLLIVRRWLAGSLANEKGVAPLLRLIETTWM